MTAAAKNLDLSVLPPECRAPYSRYRPHVWRNWRRRGQRQEHLIAGIHHALYGKKSGKLNDDARQLAFEDLEVARAGIEEKRSEHGSRRRKAQA